MSAKAFWLCVVLGLLCALVLVAWMLSQWYLSNYTEDVEGRLELLVELRKGAIEQYFSTADAELEFWSTNRDILNAQKEFNSLWEGTQAGHMVQEIRTHYIVKNAGSEKMSDLHDAMDGSGYSTLHKRLHPFTKLFVSTRGYYDMFLIGTNGDVYYTVEKEDDFASNLLTGPWRDSGLAKVFSRALTASHQEVIISDLQPYGPSDNAPAIFMGTAMHDENGAAIGVIVFQLPTDNILKIMAYTQGMGDTGETYLVGQDNLMRSNSRFSDHPTVLNQKVDTIAVKKALAGETGAEFIVDYRGEDVLSAYTYLDVGEHRWAVIAEFDRKEIVASSAEERPALAGTLLFIYGLSLWSVWYWQSSKMNTGAVESGVPDLDLEMGGFPDPPAMGG